MLDLTINDLPTVIINSSSIVVSLVREWVNVYGPWMQFRKRLGTRSDYYNELRV